MKTFYWHDYETWGATPSVDRPSQFAGVRTDENLNVISDPLVIYCRPPEDLWPNPEACLVTGIAPQLAREKGLSENEFIAKIHRELAQPGTCGVGYNSLRFDDEITRYTLYRNFYDPYEREWRNGNSRWDIIDMVRLVYALRPSGIEWPVVDGKPSFKLELLTQANGIAHESAHDAYSDVDATIKLAKLVKQKQPGLYDYVLKIKAKKAAAELIDIRHKKPLLHISSMFPSERGCAGLVVPLAEHPVNKNAVVFYDLSVDPEPLLSLSAEQIHERVFTAQDQLPEGQERIPLKLVHVNKCPILATPKLLDAEAASRLGIDKTVCERHWQQLRNADLEAKLQAMYKLDNFEPSTDPETQLYQGFINSRDKGVMKSLRAAGAGQIADATFDFDDARLNAMFPLYRARNFPQTLSQEQSSEWQQYVRQRLMNGGDKRLSLLEIEAKITALIEELNDQPAKVEVLITLRAYVEEIKAKYQM